MLVPQGIFSGLGTPLSDLIGIVFGIRQKHPAGRTGDDFIAIETDCIVIAESTCFPSFVSCTKGLRRILNNESIVFFGNFQNLIYLPGSSIKMS